MNASKNAILDGCTEEYRKCRPPPQTTVKRQNFNHIYFFLQIQDLEVKYFKSQLKNAIEFSCVNANIPLWLELKCTKFLSDHRHTQPSPLSFIHYRRLIFEKSGQTFQFISYCQMFTWKGLHYNVVTCCRIFWVFYIDRFCLVCDWNPTIGYDLSTLFKVCLQYPDHHWNPNIWRPDLIGLLSSCCIHWHTAAGGVML